MEIIQSILIQPAVKVLLSYATSKTKVDQEYDLYIHSPARKLYGYYMNQELVGCIGIEIDDVHCVIKHIAVSPAHRGKGIGREMIQFSSHHNSFSSIYAETDRDAVIFYKNIGFHITSLGEKYPGVERFACLLAGATLLQLSTST